VFRTAENVALIDHDTSSLQAVPQETKDDLVSKQLWLKVWDGMFNVDLCIMSVCLSVHIRGFHVELHQEKYLEYLEEQKEAQREFKKSGLFIHFILSSSQHHAAKYKKFKRFTRYLDTLIELYWTFSSLMA
jgi:hypothetical protein